MNSAQKHKTCGEFYDLRTLKSGALNSRYAKRDRIILVHRRVFVWKNHKAGAAGFPRAAYRGSPTRRRKRFRDQETAS
jgi:hypothetical protein